MSNVQAAIKVADQLISRIFDQRQFTSGEINYFVKELEEKANLEKSFDKLLRVSENVCVISDTYASDQCKSSDKLALNISEQVNSLRDDTERLLRIEDTHRLKEDEFLGPQRVERDKKQEECLRSATIKYEQLKESLLQEEIEIERKYLLLEENMRNSSISTMEQDDQMQSQVDELHLQLHWLQFLGLG